MSGTERHGNGDDGEQHPMDAENEHGFDNLFDNPEDEFIEMEEPAEAVSPPKTATKSYDDLTEENAVLKDRLLKALAETENLRKRAAREKADASKFAISNFSRDILEVADNLRRALDSVGDDERAVASEALSTLLDGVELTERVLIGALEKNKVKQVSPSGEKFDPNFHQAIVEIPGSDQPHGTVIDVVQVGYVIDDRILRPAMVTVAKGNPQAAPAPSADPAPAEEPPAAEGGSEEEGPEPGSTINTTA